MLQHTTNTAKSQGQNGEHMITIYGMAVIFSGASNETNFTDLILPYFSHKSKGILDISINSVLY
jgi:hypothetical protein